MQSITLHGSASQRQAHRQENQPAVARRSELPMSGDRLPIPGSLPSLSLDYQQSTIHEISNNRQQLDEHKRVVLVVAVVCQYSLVNTVTGY